MVGIQARQILSYLTPVLAVAALAVSAAPRAHGAPQADPSDGWQWLDAELGKAGSPGLSGVGALRAGGEVTYRVVAQPGAFAALLFGQDVSSQGTSFAGGTIHVDDEFALVPIDLDANGVGERSFPITVAPSSVYVQAVTVDAFGAFRFSNTIGSNRGHQWVVDPTPITWSERAGHGAAVLNDRVYLMAGQPSFLPLNDVHRFDGQKWVQLLANDPDATNRFSPRTEAGITAHAGRLWVALGSTTSGYATDMWSSADGVSWKLEDADLASSGGPGPRKNARLISFQGKLWMLGGFYKQSTTQKPTSLYLNEVWSYDTQTKAWKRHVAPWKGREDHAVVVHGGRMHVIGGNSVASDAIPYDFVRFDDVWSTADGVHWKLETSSAGFLPMTEHTAESFDGELQMFGGYQNTFNYQWRSSNGGSAWTVPIELGGPAYSFGNKPIASAAKDAMPDIVRYDAVSFVYRDRLWSVGGYSVSQPYNPVVYSD